MTKIFLALTTSSRYLASGGPCALSVATARQNVVKPCEVRSGKVADGVTASSPACFHNGPAALLAPENDGPTTATTFESPMSLRAAGGDPAPSAGGRQQGRYSRLNGRSPLALACLTASRTPRSSLIPAPGYRPRAGPGSQSCTSVCCPNRRCSHRCCRHKRLLRGPERRVRRP